MGEIQFSGSVSAQAGPEPVKIFVTLPGGTEVIVNATTDVDGNFDVTTSFLDLGHYEAYAHFDEDGKYKAFDTPKVTFVILGERTGVLNVTIP